MWNAKHVNSSPTDQVFARPSTEKTSGHPHTWHKIKPLGKGLLCPVQGHQCPGQLKLITMTYATRYAMQSYALSDVHPDVALASS